MNEVLKTEDERAKAQALGEEISKKFQRSTSSVEGYNGVLGLKHHGWHRLPEGKLRAVGVLHNFYIKRADGTTAAERLLGEKPDDLWAWIAERFRKLPLPRQRPSFDPSSVQIH